MPEENARFHSALLDLTADIVSAYVSKNSVPVSILPELIESVNLSLLSISQTTGETAPSLVPAVNPKRSVTLDYIICLEDGKKFKSLKRHISTYYGLTPDAYRAKWKLPADYPMVAPNYTAVRSQLAKSIGLGRQRSTKPLKKPPMKPKPPKTKL